MLSSRPTVFSLENQAYPLKTPKRAKNRVENDVPTTRGPNKVNLKEAALRTPFRADTQLSLKNSGVNTAHGKSILVVPRTISRPLGDKTPFPNRTQNQQLETPGPQLSKPQTLSFIELPPQTQTPESQLRPSSARKQDRVPRSGSKSFETPLNKGNYWDVSETSIVLPEVSIQEEQEPEDDYDEIEYMPPNTLDLAYEPPFDFELPDYKEVGKTLFKLAHSYPCEDIAVAEIEVSENDIQLPGWDMLSLPEIESDDLFAMGFTAENSVKPPPSRKPPALSRERIRPESKGAKSATSGTKPALRSTSVVSKSSTALPPRPASSVARPTRTLSKPTAEDGVRGSRSLRPPVVTAKPQSNPKTKVTTTPRAPAPTTTATLRSAATSRPASSAAITRTRSRTAVITGTALTAASSTRQRPATSASSYKTVSTRVPSSTTTITTTASTKRAGVMSRNENKERGVATATKKKDLQAGSGDTVLFVETKMELDDVDDIRFEL